MFKKNLCRLSAICLICLCGCAKGEISDSSVKSEEILTETTKAPKIATEEASEIIEVSTFCAPPVEEDAEEPEEITEESTGEVDINGYGWVQLQYSAPYNITENHLTRSNGSIRYNGHRETWYSTNEAAGQETARSIPDKHVADDGTIRDADGYICVASSDLDFYTIVMTSVGPGKVYDCGCSHGTIDVYTNW